MFDTPRVADGFVAHRRHSCGYGCGSLRALGARGALGMNANLWVGCQPEHKDAATMTSGDNRKNTIRYISCGQFSGRRALCIGAR